MSESGMTTISTKFLTDEKMVADQQASQAPMPMILVKVASYVSECPPPLKDLRLCRGPTSYLYHAGHDDLSRHIPASPPEAG